MPKHMYEKHNKANTATGLYQNSDTTSKQKPKTYPVKDANVRKPDQVLGDGTKMKQTPDLDGKTKYVRDKETGKLREYNSERYVDVKKKNWNPSKNKKTPPPTKQTTLKKSFYYKATLKDNSED